MPRGYRSDGTPLGGCRPKRGPGWGRLYCRLPLEVIATIRAKGVGWLIKWVEIGRAHDERESR